MLNPFIQSLFNFEQGKKDLNPFLFALAIPSQSPEPTKSFAFSNCSPALQLYKNETQLLVAVYKENESNKDSTIQWTSSNATIASVSETGLVQAVGVGIATITASSNGLQASCRVRTFSGNLYVSLDQNNQIYHLTVNQSDGILSPDSSYNVDLAPTGIAADPLGRFLYVANFTTGSISKFTINSSTGALTANGSLGGITNPRNMVISPDGNFLYLAAEGNQRILTYPIQASDGDLLTPLQTDTNALTANVGISPDGKYLASLVNSLSRVRTYSRNSTSGELSVAKTSENLSHTGSGNIGFNPNGNYFYLANNAHIFAFQFNQTSGDFTQIGSATLQSGSAIANGICVHPSGNFLYTVGLSDQIVRTYNINQSDGSISFANEINTSGGSIRYLVFDPKGKYAYLADNSGDLKSYSVNSQTGALSSLQSINLSAGQWNLHFQ
ncbi:bacterial Ig-like domain, group 2 [Leptospira ryugenii]|uniref:Bacterial Ig-like domain, group 2 n=1 Tax=Leptospira ryugenii TaxID=1917863 RepID=A0A2P2E4L3_9LEPT|nr:bacterial Ig-like domain, group 2 [Leptospira ryugenii]